MRVGEKIKKAKDDPTEEMSFQGNNKVHCARREKTIHPEAATDSTSHGKKRKAQTRWTFKEVTLKDLGLAK